MRRITMDNVRGPKAARRHDSAENRAKRFLLRNRIPGYRFTEKRCGDGDGFDIWCRRAGGKSFKVEIKATDMVYRSSRRSDIRKQLYFSRSHEIRLFEAGELKVARVFLGGPTPAVLMFDISIQRGKKLKPEPRAYLSGPLDYRKVRHIF